MTKRRAIMELLIADIFWGFSFVAIPMAQTIWSSSQITFIRFAVPSLFGLFYFLIYKPSGLKRSLFLHGLLPGLFFALTIYLQTFGLKYTTPSKSSFITVLYVVIVPIIESISKKKFLKPIFWFFLVSGLFGLSLLLNLRATSWNVGDSITLLCATMASWHIHQIGNISKTISNPFEFNIIQCFWAGTFILPLALYNDQDWLPMERITSSALFGLFMIVFGATLLAFTIQARVQKYLSNSTSAIIFLLESPMAMFFSWLLLKESFTLIQIAGSMIMLLSCYGATANSYFDVEMASET